MPDPANASPSVRAADGTSMVAIIGIAAVAFLIQLALFATGPWGSDDTIYWYDAGEWLRAFPFIGTDHWSLRHTLVLPLALARGLFGNGPTVLMLPTLLAALATVAMLTVWVGRTSGLLAAALATALVVTGPLLVTLSTTALVDPIEAMYLVLALMLMHREMQRQDTQATPRWPALLLAGICAGLALLSRETAAFAVAAVGLLFLCGFGMHRLWYLITAAGFALVLGAETLLYWITTGNPLYRFGIASNHDLLIDRWVDQGAGVPLLHPMIDPITMVLANHNFGVIFLLGVPLTIWLLRRPDLSRATRTQVIMLATVALVWSLIAGYLFSKLVLIPRYFLPPAIACSALAGIALARLWRGGHQRLAASGALLMIVANLVGSSVDNHSFMFAEQELVRQAHQGATLHTDAETRRRAMLMLQWDGASARVPETPPHSGDIVLENLMRPLAPSHPGWTLIARIPPPPTLVQRGFAMLGIPLPAWTDRILASGHPGVTLYRVN